MLTHPRLVFLSERITQGKTGLRFLDLYVAQSLIDELSMPNSVPGSSEYADELLDESVDLIVALSFSPLEGVMALPLEADAYLGFSALMKTQLLYLPTIDRLPDILAAFGERDLLKPDSIVSQSPLVGTELGIYLRRLWRGQHDLDVWLNTQNKQLDAIQHEDSAELDDRLVSWFRILFPLSSENGRASKTVQQHGDIDWQAVAAAQALTQPFTLLTGGPGTGKTSTAARMLLLLMLKHAVQSMGGGDSSSDRPAAPLKVRLLAPTGKAAQRLSQAIGGQVDVLLRSLDLPEPLAHWLKLSLPERGETLHRALQSVPGSSPFGAGLVSDTYLSSRDLLMPGKPSLSVDILIVDEASMIDMELMRMLVNALPACEMVMMGDHYQLPPVETGEVFARWVECADTRSYGTNQLVQLGRYYPAAALAIEGEDEGDGESEGKGARLLCQLTKTYRFAGVIGELAQNLRDCNGLDLASLMPQETAFGRETQDGDLLQRPSMVWYDLGRVADQASASLEWTEALSNMLEGYREYFNLVDRGASIEALAKAQAEFQILCAIYGGKLGVHNLNKLVEEHFRAGQLLYSGKLVMVTRNQPALDIYNGDIGILTRSDQERTSWLVAFAGANGSILTLPLERVLQWESAYAISIHKSQGSEYQRIAVVIPQETEERVSRRLLYTAVTRGQSGIELWASAKCLRELS